MVRAPCPLPRLDTPQGTGTAPAIPAMASPPDSHLAQAELSIAGIGHGRLDSLSPVASRVAHVRHRAARAIALLALALLALLTGCAAPRALTNSRPFDFAKDTFAFENELVWEYGFNAEGQWTSRQRDPKPDYYHRCFVVAKAAQQFYRAALFDTNQTVASDATYRKLVRRVLKKNPRRLTPDEHKVVIPGYASLRDFSKAHEQVLKSECGGPWASYFQRGHWRMVLPFSRRHQAGQAEKLIHRLQTERTAIIHLVRFPSLSINHAAVVFAAEEDANQIRFHLYDPNNMEEPAQLIFNRDERRFFFPRNKYFAGGRVDIYLVYDNWAY